MNLNAITNLLEEVGATTDNLLGAFGLLASFWPLVANVVVDNDFLTPLLPLSTDPRGLLLVSADEPFITTTIAV